MSAFVYPRTYRLTYLSDSAAIAQLKGLTAVHEGKEIPLREESTRDFDCHAHRNDPHFVHFSVIKRFDETRDVPIWLNIFSIPWERVVSVELVRDDSDHAVPQNALDLEELHARTNGIAE